MRIEALARRDREDAPLLVENDAPLGKIELERRALVPRLGEQRPAVPERAQNLDNLPSRPREGSGEGLTVRHTHRCVERTRGTV